MSDDRKLRLVKAPREERDLEAPPTPEELRAAAVLRDALEGEGEGDALRIKAAFDPSPIAEPDHEAILARVLGGDESRTTKVEARAAESLRAAIEAEDASHEGAALALALKNAHAPAAIDPARNELLVAGALAKAKPAQRTRSGRVVAITMAAMSGIAALAAGVALSISNHATAPTAAMTAPAIVVAMPAMIEARSTQSLFDAATPFPKEGGESARIDRIVTARAADLRDNRFAAWGVR